MKKYILIFISIIVVVFGVSSIKDSLLLKDVFVFNDKDVVSTTLLLEQGVPDDFDYKLNKDLVNDISDVLVNSKKKRISGDKFAVSYSPKGIEIFLDGEKKETKEDFHMTFRRHITLIKEDDGVHVAIYVNDIEDNEINNLLSRYYVVESKELDEIIGELYECNKLINKNIKSK